MTPPRPHQPLLTVVWQRCSVLVSLLLLQSMSQVILEAHEDLIAANTIIPLFLTMLVGAGGNAGNQAAVRTITGLATGDVSPLHWRAVLRSEAWVGFWCAAFLFFIGLLRVLVFAANDDDLRTPVPVTVFAISAALFLIVFTSVIVGAALPFALHAAGLNVEHAAPAIQVVMDIAGVFITCTTCAALLPSVLPPKPTGGVDRVQGTQPP